MEILDDITSFDIYLYTMLVVNVLEAFPKPFNVRYYCVNAAFLIVILFLLLFLGVVLSVVFLFFSY